MYHGNLIYSLKSHDYYEVQKTQLLPEGGMDECYRRSAAAWWGVGGRRRRRLVVAVGGSVTSDLYRHTRAMRNVPLTNRFFWCLSVNKFLSFSLGFVVAVDVVDSIAFRWLQLTIPNESWASRVVLCCWCCAFSGAFSSTLTHFCAGNKAAICFSCRSITGAR